VPGCVGNPSEGAAEAFGLETYVHHHARLIVSKQTTARSIGSRRGADRNVLCKPRHAESQRKTGVPIRVVPLLEPTPRITCVAQLRRLRLAWTAWTALPTPDVGTQPQPATPPGPEAGGRAVRAVLRIQCWWTGPGSSAGLRWHAHMVDGCDHEAQGTAPVAATQASRGAPPMQV